MKKDYTREEILKRIKKKRDVLDEIDAFMLGIDAPIERELMRYIWNNHNVVNFQMLVLHFVNNQGICTKAKLERRLESLCKFNFIKRSDYKGTIFYEVVKEETTTQKEKVK